MQQKSYPLRIHPKIKEAVMLGDAYVELKTLVQFYEKQITFVERRIKRMEAIMQTFFAEGGDVVYDENDEKAIVEFPGPNGDTVSFTAHYDENGDIHSYTVTKCKDDNLRIRLYQMLFTITVLPYYQEHLENIKGLLKDIKNSYAINALSDIGKQIRGDRITTMSAINGININEITDSVDPFEVFNEVD